MSRVPFPTALPALALCALVLAAFFPALGAGFVWDDVAFTGAEVVQNWSGLAQIWFAPGVLSKEGHYWPLVYTTFWLEHKLWGFNHPLGFHIVNLLLHSAVTVLLWRVLRRLNIPGAWLAAAVFAVHPVHVEAVAWVIGRKDVLAALFFLASTLCYIGFAEQHRRRDYLFALVLFIFGMFSKSIVVTLPAALLVWHWWRQGRVAATDFARVLPFFLIGFVITLADWAQYAAREAWVADYSFIERTQIATQALWFYLGKLFWPTGLAVIYPHFTVGVDEPLAWAALIAALALAAALWFARHRIGRGPLAGSAFFALVLSPVLGFIDYGFMQFSFVADRYQYLAAGGVIVVCVGAATRAARALRTTAKTAAPAAVVSATLLLTVFGALTWQQAALYKNDGTLFAHIIALNPQARGAHDNYGIWLRDEGRLEEAHAAFRVAAEQRPDWEWAHIGLGKTADEMGRADEAEAHFEEAVRVAPQSTDALDHLAALRLRQKRYQDALTLFQTMLRLAPDNAKFYFGRGVALSELGRLDEALRDLNRALAMNPSLDNAHARRETVLQMMGKSE